LQKKSVNETAKKSQSEQPFFFQTHLEPEVKTMMGQRMSKQMKKRKITDIEIIDWMLAIDLDPSQIPLLFF
jgi:hypothetical protein